MHNYICFLLALAIMTKSIDASIKLNTNLTFTCSPNCSKITLGNKELLSPISPVIEEKSISFGEKIVFEILNGDTVGRCGIEATINIDSFVFVTDKDTQWTFPKEFSNYDKTKTKFIGSEHCEINKKYEVTFTVPSSYEDLNDKKQSFAQSFEVTSSEFWIPKGDEYFDLDMIYMLISGVDFESLPIKFTYDETQTDELKIRYNNRHIESGKTYSLPEGNTTIRYVIDPSKGYQIRIKFQVYRVFDSFELQDSNEGILTIIVPAPNCKTQNGNECSTCDEGFIFKDGSFSACYLKDDLPYNYGKSQTVPNMYLPCHETCMRCSIVGDSSSHKCTECDDNFPNQTEDGDTFNCFKSTSRSDEMIWQFTRKWLK